MLIELKVTSDEVGYTEWGVHERKAGDTRDVSFRDHVNYLISEATKQHGTS